MRRKYIQLRGIYGEIMPIIAERDAALADAAKLREERDNTYESLQDETSRAEMLGAEAARLRDALRDVVTRWRELFRCEEEFGVGCDACSEYADHLDTAIVSCEPLGAPSTTGEPTAWGPEHPNYDEMGQ